MYLFVKTGMRGGISYNDKRYSKTSNKYMKFYNDSKPSKYIMYLDANNLHGWAMSQCLPYNKFKWLNRKEIDKFDVVKNWWIWWRHIRSLYWTSSLITWIT